MSPKPPDIERSAPVTGRFAPSPTGELHLGSLRTALVAWLLARSAGGRFLLRVEDIDPDRSRASWEARQIAALAELGISWDGPVVRQSERLALYGSALAELDAAGRVYPCFCTRAEVRAAASALHRAAASAPHRAAATGGGPSVDGDLPAGAYPGTCRRLSAAERSRRVAAGERHVLRFDGGGERMRCVDELAGPQAFTVDDFVLRRSDGVFAYQLAVVVDDADQGVTQVARGADLLDSVGRQTLLARALGFPSPEWFHVPLVLGPDGKRLAKRYGSSAGPASPTETLALLAGSLGIVTEGRRPPSRAADLLTGFDPALIPAEPLRLG